MAIPRPLGPDRYRWRPSPVNIVEYCAQLERFIKLHGNDMRRLRKYLDDGEHEFAYDVARNIKGIAQLIGARRVALLATELMRSIRNGTEQALVVELTEACELEFTRLTEAVKPASPMRAAAKSSLAN